MDNEKINFIKFTASEPLCTAIRAWQLKTNRRIIETYVEHELFLRVMHLDRPGFKILKKIPAPDEAYEPLASDFAGGYIYIFHPHQNGCRLVVDSYVNDKSDIPLTIEPLELETHHKITVQSATKAQIEGMKFHDMIKSNEPSTSRKWSLELVTTAEIIFWIYPRIYPKLLAYGWSPNRLNDYHYSFQYSSIGTFVMVTHNETGQQINATEDISF